MKTNGDFTFAQGILYGDRRRSKRLSVFYRIGIICDPVRTAEGTVMNCFQQICFTGAVPSEKQIDAGIGIKRQLTVISEVFQFQFFYQHLH